MSTSAAPPYLAPQRVLCVVVVVVMLAATIYAVWIGISNFSEIGV